MNGVGDLGPAAQWGVAGWVCGTFRRVCVSCQPVAGSQSHCPARPGARYLVQGPVGVRVTEGERGLLPEPLPELVLLELRESHAETSHACPPTLQPLRPGPRPRGPRDLELLALPPQDVDLVGLEGSHVLLHLEGQLLGVGPLLRQLLWRQRPGRLLSLLLFKLSLVK